MWPEDEDERADRLIARLREGASEAEPMSERVRRAADGAFAARGVEAPVAEVVGDSLEPDGGVRPSALRGPRYVLLRGVGVQVEVHLEITGHAGHRRIAGRVVPPGAGTVEVRSPVGAREFPVDEGGGFTAASVPRGPVRLLVSDDEGPRVVSSWLPL
ncbi:hypothetical protein [Nocardiopsis halophila]|uniref:hypothetical protein n=1 Tax=Nocardiopsis halophila TaxID=141692 RepID=UPI00034B3F14|nr:hypothetical protein [Nocardiopsis halophila]